MTDGPDADRTDGLYFGGRDLPGVIGIVVSRPDEASVAIGERLLALGTWSEREDPERADASGGGTYYESDAPDGFELREFDELHLHLEDAARRFGDGGTDLADSDPEMVVFVSRHAGETGPLLSAHFTGNVGPAEHGGRPNELAHACPNALARVVGALAEHAPDGYEVGIECTHHGPSRVGAPSMFVEVGSAEPQWHDAEAAAAVARSVLDLRGVPPVRERTVVGFGGGHYAPRFERVVRETDWAVGHVVADWAIEAAEAVPASVIDQAFERSGATRAVIDGDRPAVARAVAGRGYDVVSETWVRETAGVPLGAVERAESTLCSVEEGLRFGDREAAAAADLHVVTVNPDLVSAAYGVDPEGTRRAVASAAVAYETEESGNRPTGRVALPSPAAVDAVVDSLAAIFADDGAETERLDDELIVRETAFDPRRARDLGVPEGPAFGRLAAGEPVEVEGETVRPEAVHAERTRRFSLLVERD